MALGLLLVAASVAKRAWLHPTIETQASEWRSLALNDGSSRQHRAANAAAQPVRRAAALAAPGERRSAVRSREGCVASFHRRCRARRGSRDGHADSECSRRDLEVVVTVEEGTVLVSRDDPRSSAVAIGARRAGDRGRSAGLLSSGT